MSPGAGGALTDRWRIHHGDPTDVHWAYAAIDAMRFESRVIDGDALTRPNPLAAAEPAVCRWLNTDHRAELPRLARAYAGINASAPVAAGIDPDGRTSAPATRLTYSRCRLRRNRSMSLPDFSSLKIATCRPS